MEPGWLIQWQGWVEEGRGQGMPGRSVAEIRTWRPWGKRCKRESWKMKMERKIKVT